MSLRKNRNKFHPTNPKLGFKGTGRYASSYPQATHMIPSRKKGDEIGALAAAVREHVSREVEQRFAELEDRAAVAVTTEPTSFDALRSLMGSAAPKLVVIAVTSTWPESVTGRLKGRRYDYIMIHPKSFATLVERVAEDVGLKTNEAQRAALPLVEWLHGVPVEHLDDREDDTAAQRGARAHRRREIFEDVGQGFGNYFQEYRR